MRMSGGVEWAVHCCVVLTDVERPVPAATLAKLHDVSMTYLAKQMQALARADLVRSVQGKAGGYVLTRSPDDITVLDVVLAIEGPEPQFVCTEIRQRGPLGTPPEDCRTACPVAKAMLKAEAAWRGALKEVSIGDLVREVDRSSGKDALATIRAWFGGDAA
ncbi:Rrf2 family transcriptional regulator [Microbacterium sp. NPDC019599]|uniref:RrF2 family transcriptional regulator n=1 Tax=Microbacterium sp. NPDC019599 TaxID=3154690 RepID=UPI0033D3C3B5